MRRLTVRAINGALLPHSSIAALSVVTDSANTFAAFLSLDNGSSVAAPTGTVENPDGPVVTFRKSDGAVWASGPISDRVALLTGSDGSLYTATVETLPAP